MPHTLDEQQAGGGVSVQALGDEASRDIDRQKDELLDEIGWRLEQSVEQTPLFTMRWRIT